MKNFIFLTLIGLGCITSSCKKEEDKACYEFTITTVSNIIPSPDSTYPRTTVEVQEECDMTESDARQSMDFYNKSRSHDHNGTTFTFVTTCTYMRK